MFGFKYAIFMEYLILINEGKRLIKEASDGRKTSIFRLIPFPAYLSLV